VLTMLIALTSSVIGDDDPYSHVITDEEGDVSYISGTGWLYDVERPNVDILRAEVSESGGVVTFALTVKGVIVSADDHHYNMYLECDDDGFYSMYFVDGTCQVWVSNDQGWSIYQEDAQGVGTNTLTVSSSLESLLNPVSLRFTAIYAYDHSDPDGYHWDFAYPDDDTQHGFIPVNFELDVYPNSGTAPLTVWIEADVENIGNEAGSVPISIDGVVVETVDVGPNGFAGWVFTHVFDEPGTYTVVFGDESATVTVMDEPVDPIEPTTPYSDVVTDPEDDVIRLVDPHEDDWALVSSPDTDILRVEISESGGMVTVSLRVKGTIRNDPDIEYELFLKDNANGEYDIWYNDGDWEMIAYREYDRGGFANTFKPAVSGVGTNTLSFTFSREQIGEPDVLLISWVAVYNEAYPEVDLAGPDVQYPPGYQDPTNGTPPTDNGTPPDDEKPKDDDDSPGFALVLLVIAVVSAVLIYHKKR